MTIPKKGSRKITVEEVNYRWAITRKPPRSQDLDNANVSAAVELAENPRSVLSISFSGVGYDKWIGIAPKPVTPKHIETCIKRALNEGWQPNKNGSAFTKTSD